MPIANKMPNWPSKKPNLRNIKMDNTFRDVGINTPSKVPSFFVALIDFLSWSSFFIKDLVTIIVFLLSFLKSALG